MSLDDIPVNIQIPPHLFICPSADGAITKSVGIQRFVHTGYFVIIIHHVEYILWQLQNLNRLVDPTHATINTTLVLTSIFRLSRVSLELLGITIVPRCTAQLSTSWEGVTSLERAFPRRPAASMSTGSVKNGDLYCPSGQ